MIDIYEEISNRTIYIEKELNIRIWYVRDNVTDVIGKGITRTAALACYNRGLALWQMKQAGYDIADWDRFHDLN